MMPTWKPATYRPDAPSGSSGEVRMAADCSIGGNAVDAAPHSTIAATPITTAIRPADRSNASDVNVANANASTARQPTTEACGHRSSGRAIAAIETSPATPNAANSHASAGPCTPTTSRTITTMNV